MQPHPITLPAFGALLATHGGHFAGVMRGPVVDGVEQPPYAIIVAPRETETTATWGEYGKDIEGARDRRDGATNTAAMAAAECPAALRAREVTAGGLTDWYLPSLGEMNTAHANVPELFETDGWYWTSTQISRYTAFAQYFEDGFSYWYGKDDELRVRAFRRVQLETLIA